MADILSGARDGVERRNVNLTYMCSPTVYRTHIDADRKRV